MRETVVIGAGVHKFGRFPQTPYAELGRVAITEALRDAGVEWKQIQVCYAGSAIQGMGAGHNVCALLGRTGIPIYNLEAACGSGTAGVTLAMQAIGLGIYDIACVVGFEKQARGTIPAENYPMWARLVGLGNYIGLEAMSAQRYMYEYGATIEDLAYVAAKSHRHAALCPHAAYNKQGNMTIEDVLNSRVLAYPITMFMVGVALDGAAALILCAREVAHKYTDKKPVSIAASRLVTNLYNSGESSFAIGGRREIRRAAKEAYQIAGCSPEEIDVVSCPDQFAIAEIMQAEDLGFCREGEGYKFVRSGATALGGKVPFNTDGSFISRGNAMGANGVAGLVEIYWQLTGSAGSRQVPDAKTGLASSMGAGINAFITILKA